MLNTNPQAELPRDDMRLYVPDSEAHQVQIMRGGEREYCFAQNPGEDFFHLLVAGEVYVQYGDEKYCLNCAMRRGMITADRLYWQRRGSQSEIQTAKPEATSGPE